MLPRHLALVASLSALTLIAAACGGEPEPAGDARVAVHAGLPLSGALAGGGRDAADGARLALAEAGAEAGGVPVRLEIADTGGSATGSAEAAREATEDSTSVAYLGDLLSGATRASLPITNEARILQVSPGAGAGDLVAEFEGADDPGPVQPTGERTFGRVVPSDARQAGAAALWLVEEGAVEEVYVEDDGSRYGRELGLAFEEAAERAGLELGAGGGSEEPSGPPRPDVALYHAGQSSGGLAPALEAAARVRAAVLVLSDAALDPGFLGSTPAAAVSPRLGAPEIRAVASTLDPAHLPPAAADFEAAFRERFGRKAGRYSAYGYEAMALILDAIARASDPTDREAVVDAFFAGEGRAGVPGRYAVTERGESTLERMSGYELAGGEWLPREVLNAP